MSKNPWQQITHSTARMLESHGFTVLWAEPNEAAPTWVAGVEEAQREFLGTEKKKPHAPLWLHEMLTRVAPMLLHNTAANHGARNVWLEWVATNQKGLSAAHRVGGSVAMWAVYDASYARKQPVTAVRFVPRKRSKA